MRKGWGKLLSYILIACLAVPTQAVWADTENAEPAGDVSYTDLQSEEGLEGYEDSGFSDEADDMGDEVTDTDAPDTDAPDTESTGDVSAEEYDTDPSDEESIVSPENGSQEADPSEETLDETPDTEDEIIEEIEEIDSDELLSGALSGGTWVTEDGDIRYLMQNGNYVKNNFAKIDGKWFYFDKNGYIVTGWRKISGLTYYFHKTGSAGVKGYMYTGWKVINKNTYYFKASGDKGVIGQRFHGLQKVGKNTYYFGSDGVVQVGLQKIGSNTYYFRKTGNTGTLGKMLTGWRTFGTKTYYFKKNGSKGDQGRMAIGWRNLNNQTFYFAKNGVMAQGLTKIGSYRYYFRKSGDAGTSGKLLYGWLKIKGKNYYFRKTGKAGVRGRAATGWGNLGKKTFYFKSNGQIATGFTKVGSNTFYFKQTGALGVKGQMFTGLRKIGTKTYYFRKTSKYGVKGAMFVNRTATINNVNYKFDSKGVATKVTTPTLVNGYYRVKDPNGYTYSMEKQYYSDPQIGGGSNQVTTTEWLAAVLHTEAGNQGLTGQIMVGLTLYNRTLGVEGENFPTTLKNVVYMKGHYEVVSNGMLTKTLIAIRDNNRTKINEMTNDKSFEAARQTIKIMNDYKSGKVSKRIVPGLSKSDTAFYNKDFSYAFFMTPGAFERLKLSKSGCQAVVYNPNKRNSGHIFFKKWVKA